MTNNFSDAQNKERLLAFREFLGKIKQDHPNELKELKTSELAMFEFQNNAPILRIHAKINAALRKIIYAKWMELFPAAWMLSFFFHAFSCTLIWQVDEWGRKNQLRRRRCVPTPTHISIYVHHFCETPWGHVVGSCRIHHLYLSLLTIPKCSTQI